MNGNNNFQMYQNSGYTNNRNRKRTLILDIDDIGETNLGVTGEFNVELYEPLVIDKHSEVYLDNFTSYNSNLANDVDSAAFSLKINEFNMNSNVASTRGVSTDSETGRTTPGDQHMFNSLIIPNEHRNPANFQTSVVHKGKKFNYVCDINPGTIHSLSGRITDLIGRPAFHDNVSSGTFTYTILDATITIDNGRESIVGSESFSATTNINGTGGAISSGVFPANTNLSNRTLTFTTTEQINTIGSSPPITGVNTNISGVGNFTFTLADASTLRVSPNSSTILIQGHGRFIAEFSIISRD